MTDDEHEAAQTDRIRDAAPDEDRLIRYLSRVMGQVALQAWSQLPPEMKEGYSMALTISAALTHNLGAMLAAAPKDAIGVDDPAFRQFIETTCDLVRANAISRRLEVLRALPGAPAPAASDDPQLPPLSVAQPKFLM